MHRRLIGLSLLLLWLQAPAMAQDLPLLPKAVHVRAGQQSGDRLTWQIGPLRLALPSTWKNTSTDLVASLQGPQKAVATFVLAQATPEALASGYSLLSDERSDTEAFLDVLQWDDCIGNPKRTAVSFASVKGNRAYYSKCAVELRPGAPGTYVQAAIYSRTRVLQLHAVGTEQAMSEFLRALSKYGWLE